LGIVSVIVPDSASLRRLFAARRVNEP